MSTIDGNPAVKPEVGAELVATGTVHDQGIDSAQFDQPGLDDTTAPVRSHPAGADLKGPEQFTAEKVRSAEGAAATVTETTQRPLRRPPQSSRGPSR